jgi:superfamily II DNA or RNA helicase
MKGFTMSTIFSLTEYQKVAMKQISKNLQRIKEDQQDNPKGKFGIQVTAPTGAGKTIIIGSLLLSDLKDYVSIVLSPGSGDLEQQTLNSLQKTVVGRVVRLDSTVIKHPSANPGDVYVSNWEALVSKDKGNAYSTKLSREGEQSNFWDLIRFFKKSNLKVAIIIDESHHGAKSAGGSIATFLEDIAKTLGVPPLFIEVSATPVVNGDAYRTSGGQLYTVNVPVEKVIAEGMLRKEVILNEGVKLYLEGLSDEELSSATSELTILDAALNRQKIIDAEYKKVGSPYHSLIAIQLPNSADGEAAKDRLTSALAARGITRAKNNIAGSLGSYMDGADGKFGDFINIASADSPLKVIFYKQGISMGWDCPRAQILVGYRHLKSNVFTKQNLGRFVRTTERKHYNNSVLDTTYVYTNTNSDLGSSGFADSLPGGASQITEVQYLREIDGRKALSSFSTLNLKGEKTVKNYKEELDYREVVELWKSMVNPVDFLSKLVPAFLEKEELLEGKMSTKDLISPKDGEHGFTKTEISLLATVEAKALFEEKLTEATRNLGRPDFDLLSPKFTEYLATFLESLVVAGIYKGSSKADGKEYYGVASSIKPEVSILQTAYAYKVLCQSENFEALKDELKPLLTKVPIHKSAVVELGDGDTLEDITMYSPEEFDYLPHEDERVNSFHLDAENDEISGYISSQKYAYARELGGSYRTERASGPELLFEATIAEMEQKTNGQIKLVSFAKNSQRMAENGFSVVIQNGNLLNKFFPDYFVEFEVIRNGVSDIVPCIFEVKDSTLNKGLGGFDDSLRKAKGLETLQKKTPGLKAGVVKPGADNSFVVVAKLEAKPEGKFGWDGSELDLAAFLRA